MKDLVTAEDVLGTPPGAELRTSVGATVTPWAREVANTRGVRIVHASAPEVTQVIALGADHGGFELKEQIKGALSRLGRRFHDHGTFSTEPVDYPDIARRVAEAVRKGEAHLGIIVDGAGIGSAMAANKVRGVRAAPCVDAAAARNAREHNDANVLTLGARFVDARRMLEILEVFLSTECVEPRHQRRVAKIMEIEGA